MNGSMFNLEVPELVNMANAELRDRCLDRAENRVRAERHLFYRILMLLAVPAVSALMTIYLQLPLWSFYILLVSLVVLHDRLFRRWRRGRLRHHVRESIKELPRVWVRIREGRA